MTFNFDLNQASNLQLQGDFELRLATTKWFFEHNEKLVNLSQESLRDEFNEFIVSRRFSDKSDKELEKAFSLVQNLQKKKKELDFRIRMKQAFRHMNQISGK